MTVDLSVYLVTDSAQAASSGHDLVDLVAAAVAAGVTAVQVREKQAPSGSFLSTVLAVAEVLPEGVALVVNDRVDVFLAARATGARVAGVHVGQSDLPAHLVRELVGPDALVGLSAATLGEVLLAHTAPGQVDYIGIGVVRATATKVDAPAPLGVTGFARLAAASSLPAVAIGGIVPADMGPLRAAGAAGAAVVSGICAASAPGSAAWTYARAWAGVA